MTPRPLHKWKAFWLGLLILASLIWAWTTSLSHGSYAAIRTGPFTWRGISSAEAQLNYTTATYRSTSHFDPSRTAFGSYGLPPRQEPIWFPVAFEISHAPNSIADQYYCRIAYWLIILLFLISWYSFLLWRRWKAKHLTDPPAQAGSTPTP